MDILNDSETQEKAEFEEKKAKNQGKARKWGNLKMKYLIIQIFQTNDFEGSYTGTEITLIECSPNQLNMEIKKLRMVIKDDILWEVCSEIIVFDESFNLVERKEVDTLKFRKSNMKEWRKRVMEDRNENQ